MVLYPGEEVFTRLRRGDRGDDREGGEEERGEGVGVMRQEVKGRKKKEP
jgi:hypothetical protein